jgi:hypothetical protein
MNYATDWSENIPADEEARFEALAARVVAVQASRTPALGPGRALHRRPVESVAATFTVREDLATVLPLPLHVGPFRPGATYKTYVRFSNGSFEAPKKEGPDVRGIGLKLVGVPGRKQLTGTEDPRTQDFLLIRGNVVPTADPAEFVALVEAGASGGQLGAPFRLGAKVGYFKAFKLISALVSETSKPFPSYATHAFNSVSAYRLGPTAARWGLSPIVAADDTAQKGAGLAADMRARVATGLTWNFRVQLFQDATRTPVEDPTVDWNTATSPWIDVARLEVPPQDPGSEAGQRLAAYIETLSFDPWHCAEDLRPLGAFNRARKPTYWASVQNRPHVPEPDGTETP